ncbi:MAG: hypothetical protein HYR70_05775 [Chloroflexi bacterium]|nr:hypothetical protein [Chloroflexota bacterium]MBI3338743.1 hypothetical protein [Chloroflexota bacterium]
MKIKNILRTWLPLAVVITAFSVLVYAAVQQALRQGLNDPQVQMAEDAAYTLNNGATVDSIAFGNKVEMSRSLAPFLVVYDSSGKPVASSGVLKGQLPTVPDGVLDNAKQNGENRVTWQPDGDVRIATVIVPYQDGYVLAGRNMREVEKRELQTEVFAGATWGLTLLASLVVIAFGEIVLADKKKQQY